MGEKDSYNFGQTEEKIKKFWEDKKIYKFDPKKKKIYSVDTPPPTVSGKMHIGHAFSYAQQDFIARYRRMKQGVYYPFGTDDNGLPTERLIEKLKGVKSKNMPRHDFIDLCLKTLKEITPDFIEGWKRLGISADFELCYSTIDDDSRKISQKSFIDLFKAGNVYNKEFPTIWCPECQTAIAQAELEDKEGNSRFSTLKFKSNGKDLLIATTRPELLPACVAVFVNPKDKRYVTLIGKKAKVPMFDFEVPILGDASADMDKGTGVLMVCSYGDRFDVEAINKHKLEPSLVLNRDGKLNELAKGYEGMKIKEARKKILGDLDEKGLIKDQKEISHVVNVHDKCGTEIEFLMTEQWFIKLLDKKKELLAQGKKIKWYPNYMFKRFENWVKGLEWDWSISRDRHFGIPIPAWKCSECKEIILADEKELPVDPLQLKKKCPKCKGNAPGEEKVLDTWATSSLTPQLASNLIKDKIKIPYSLRPQAHDIIRTWAFYTLSKSYMHEKKLPWGDVMVSGFVTLKGEKMSKSKGNVIQPQEVIDKYGADALRFWAAGSKLGEDLDYQEQDLVAGKKFITKLFNASRFVFMNLEGFNGTKPSKLEKVDELFLNRLNEVINSATKHFEKYEYSKARSETERFFWKDFADNYLEIVKDRIYNAKGDKKKSGQYVLYKSLLTVLKLIAPIMPFITEELYKKYFEKNEKTKSIHLCDWPKNEKVKENDDLRLLYELLGKIRQEKTKAQKSMKAEITLTLEKKHQAQLKDMMEDFKAVVKANELKEGKFRVEFI
jgi:valyl-tRNA synthetase